MSKTIKKSIDINAPKEKVWDVLMNDKFERIWYAEIREGAHAETDWQVGSKALFTDDSKAGIVGKVISNKPHEVIAVEYQGIIVNGVEDYDSSDAKNVKGSLEKYELKEKKGVTHLSIACDTAEIYYKSMTEAWDRALQKIKTLSESNQSQIESGEGMRFD